MPETKITVLCENTAGVPGGITGEHGFSAVIEQEDRKILFDTGQGMSLARNARCLGVDLKGVRTVVLSHGHFDHTTGLPSVLTPPRGVEIVAHPDIFTKKFGPTKTPEGEKTAYIGLRYTRAYLEDNLEGRFHLAPEFEEILPGIFFSGEVPRKTPFEKPDPRLKVERDGRLVADPLLDDASLLIETDSGPVILLGCAHAGLVNVMNHFAAKTGHSQFHALIGGTHLGFMGPPVPQIQESMDAFDQYGLNLIAPSHCTGQEAAAIIYNRFKKRFAFASAGWSHTF